MIGKPGIQGIPVISMPLTMQSLAQYREGLFAVKIVKQRNIRCQAEPDLRIPCIDDSKVK